MPDSEQRQVGYPAGLARRLGAMVYDALLVLALWMLTLFIWIAAGEGQALTGWPVQTVMLVEWAGFYWFSWLRRGQTLGMAAWRIKIVSESGGAPGPAQLAIRLAAAPLSVLSLGLGYLWFYLGNSQQTWHDRLSHTLVIYLPKQ